MSAQVNMIMELGIRGVVDRACIGRNGIARIQNVHGYLGENEALQVDHGTKSRLL